MFSDEFGDGKAIFRKNLNAKRQHESPYGTVQEGETLRDVALRFAVKPEKILRKNGMKEGDRIGMGQVLWLRYLVNTY